MTIENISATPGVLTQKSKPVEVKEFTPPKDIIWDHPVATKFWTEKQDAIKKVFNSSPQTETLSWSLKNDLATLAVVPGLTLVDLIKRLDPIKKTKTDEWVIDQGSLSSGSFGIRPRSDLARLIQVYLILEKV